MSATLFLGIACLVLVAALVINQFTFANERKQWQVERRELINRAIARHAGEVRALDHQPPRLVKPGPLDNPADRPTAVGL